jgi:flagellar biosynthesis protein FlhF
MREAMGRVRAELGVEALILGTKRVPDGIEVTAAMEPAEVQPFAPPDAGRADILAFHAIPEPLRAALSFGDLAVGLNRVLAFALLPVAGRPLLVTGPPGAGKTLTIVRLATRLVMAGIAPMIIAADDSKAGATEQLRVFTRVLGLRLIVAGDPLALTQALVRRTDGVPALIDAPGIDPFDPVQGDRLRALATAADARVVLVLPGGLDPAEAADLGLAYAAHHAEFLIATRLDVSRRLGGVLAAAAAAQLPLAEAGIGPGAADGLVPLTPDFLAARLLQTGVTRHAP